MHFACVRSWIQASSYLCFQITWRNDNWCTRNFWVNAIDFFTHIMFKNHKLVKLHMQRFCMKICLYRSKNIFWRLTFFSILYLLMFREKSNAFEQYYVWTLHEILDRYKSKSSNNCNLHLTKWLLIAICYFCKNASDSPNTDAHTSFSFLPFENY